MIFYYTMNEKLKQTSFGYRNCHTFEEGEEVITPSGAGIAIKPRNPLPTIIYGSVSPSVEPTFCEYYYRKQRLFSSTLRKHLFGE